MDNIRKSLALFLVLLIAILSVRITANYACAQSITKPSVPEFTIVIISTPYDVPTTTTTTTDPYTGNQTVTTHPGYHVENKTTEIKITNQNLTSLFYNIRIKGHFSQTWGYYRLYNGSSDGNLSQDYSSDYTIVPIDGYLPAEGKVDFQIQAMVGYERGIYTVGGAPGTSRVIFGQASNWSDIKTLSVPDGTITISTSSNRTNNPTDTPIPSSSPTPTVPEFSSFILFIFLILSFLLISISYKIIKNKVRENEPS